MCSTPSTPLHRRTLQMGDYYLHQQYALTKIHIHLNSNTLHTRLLMISNQLGCSNLIKLSRVTMRCLRPNGSFFLLHITMSKEGFWTSQREALTTSRIPAGVCWNNFLIFHSSQFTKKVSVKDSRSWKVTKGVFEYTCIFGHSTQVHVGPVDDLTDGNIPSSSPRDDICHKHHKQRLCKIIITRVKVHFGDVF